jgi:UDPglucose 6-dehydrogenase
MGKIAVIGAGYVGLTTSIGMSEIGHTVICLDIDQNKVDKLNSGTPHIFEPGLTESLQNQIMTGSFLATTSPTQAFDGVDAIFVCVDTPQGLDGEANLSSIYKVIQTVIELVQDPTLLIIKSTVPPGTAESLEAMVPPHLKIVSNPEFLREGSALYDFHNPDRIVLGASNSSSHNLAWKLYEPFSVDAVFTDLNSAELIKYSANAMLASRISFVNEIAQLCMKFSGNIKDVLRAISLDPRIGASFLNPGPGWGGSCFPKDVSALQALVNGSGMSLPMIESINNSNSTTQAFVSGVIAGLVNQNKSRVLGVWGLTFKAGTDDLRDSPAIEIIKRLASMNIEILAYDPTVIEPYPQMPKGVQILKSASEVLVRANTLAVLTEWDEFKNFIPSQEQGKDLVVFDTRLVLDSAVWAESGARLNQFGLDLTGK